MGHADLHFQRHYHPAHSCREPPHDDLLESSHEVKRKVQQILVDSNKKLTIEQLLEKAGISEEEYINSFNISRRGEYNIKCNPTDKLTNDVNLDMLCLWGGNIYFQYTVDEYSTVMYVCRYMMKSEQDMGEPLKRVAKEHKNEQISEQLKQIGYAFVGTRV